MSRTVIRVQPFGESRAVFSLEEPTLRGPGVIPGLATELPTRPGDIAFADLGETEGSIRRAGQRLFEHLRLNSTVAQGLKQTFQGTDPQPIYISLDDFLTEPDALPWETLFNGRNFPALEPGWSIGRIVHAGRLRNPQRDWTPPLRILVVLGAAGVSALPEWEALIRQVRAANLLSVSGCRIQVLTSEDVVRTAIKGLQEEEIEGLELLLDHLTRDALHKAVREMQPHLLHFFCHGMIVGSTPMLDLATQRDFIRGSDTGSLKLEESDFRDLARQNEEALLVILNCCLGGASSAEARSLAMGCVSAGFPAAIGMREPVKNTDAHSLCGQLSKEIARFFANLPGAEEILLDWAPLLVEARRELCRRRGDGSLVKASDIKEWTLPVLYVAREAVRLMPGGSQSAKRANLRAQIRELQTQREHMAQTGTPTVILQAIDEKVEQLQTDLQHLTVGTL